MRSVLSPFALIVPVMLTMTACDRKPSFDERYRQQSATLQGSANSIEQEVANRISGADAASRAVREASNGGVAP
ncbi:MAG: hypothetical protein ABW048_03240 [Sphingobium sp.]